MTTSFQVVTLFIILTTTIACMSSTLVVAQNCGCSSGLCCSRWGYCGTTSAYCGDGCQQGPCYSSTPSVGGSGSVVSIANLVTNEFFNGIKNQASSSGCAGKSFYTRSAFLSAIRSYPKFGNEGSSTIVKREVAAFFAHVTRETGHFCYKEEIAKGTYCQKNDQWPCKPKRQYYGRGPLQLTWNYNYGPAGKSIGFDGLNEPETVANDPIIAFRSALWFWMNNVHSRITSGKGFASTIRAINGGECGGRNSRAVNDRVAYYKKYCSQFGVSPGDNLSC